MSTTAFEHLTLAAELEDKDEIADLILQKLEATDEGQERLAQYDGPLPTMSVTGSVTDAFLAWFGKAAWQNTDHAYGFLAPEGTGLVDATQMPPDPTLVDQPLMVTLNRLRAFDYPGSGELQVLLQFAANHFVEGRAEPTQFTHTYAVRDGQAAGITGYPIFVNIRPGKNGLAFDVGTTLASNEGDRDLVAFLQSTAFRQGLDLAGSFSPALKMVGAFAGGLFGAIAKRNKNRGVQRFELGLGFQGMQAAAKLREGTYFAVQVPSRTLFPWSDWVYDVKTGVVVRANPAGAEPSCVEEIPYNYLAFSVSKV